MTEVQQDESQATLARFLEVLDVEPAGEDRFTGGSDGGTRKVVDGTQLLAQSIVAVSKRFPEKSVRSAHAVFSRGVNPDVPLDFVLDVVQAGRSVSTVVVAVEQQGKRCSTITVFADTPSEDVIRHATARPAVAGPADAHPSGSPLTGREIRLVDVVDVNSPDEVGPPELHAWVHYDPIPQRPELKKALLAHFTGHLSISTAMRAHEGIGTSMAHLTVSTAPMTVSVAFHEPVDWDGWLLYTHDSAQVGAGMSYTRGQIHTEAGELIASFVQEAMIRPMRTTDTNVASAARL
jgi:acyl-CoA thioesterase-2